MTELVSSVEGTPRFSIEIGVDPDYLASVLESSSTAEAKLAIKVASAIVNFIFFILFLKEYRGFLFHKLKLNSSKTDIFQLM